ncbi:MAG TPA: hypothetical protein VNZ62_00235 [Capillimicrobium sp.]|nr:hypothetical protein [Capillimicrobium sp.]
MHLSKAAWTTLAAAVAFVACSLAPWQEGAAGEVSRSAWNGIGVVAGVVGVLLAVWETVRVVRRGRRFPMPPQLPSVVLAALLLGATIATFAINDELRTAWATAGLVLALLAALAAWLDALPIVRIALATRGGGAPAGPAPADAPAPGPPPAAGSVDGTWACRMDTPLGEQTVGLWLAVDGDVLTGRADTPFGPYELLDGRVREGELTWHIPVTQPMEVDLRFRATVSGDAMTGVVDAGPFGEQPFTGERV